MAGRQAREREDPAGAMAPVLQALRAAGARANAQRDAELHRRPRGVRTAAAVECRQVWVGRCGIGAGHHDRLRFAIGPLLQADRIVQVQDGLPADPGDRLRDMNRTSA